MEIWKDVVGYKDYEASSYGRIRSKDRTMVSKGTAWTKKGQVIKPQPRSHGYLSVTLYDENGKHQTSVHRIVAMAFLEQPIGKTEVNHKDENKTNNRLENLEWCDRKENVNYGTCQERRAVKVMNGPKRSKPIRQYSLDGNFIKEYPSMAEMNRQTGFSQSNICNFIKGKNNNRHQYGYLWEYAY